MKGILVEKSGSSELPSPHSCTGFQIDGDKYLWLE